MKTDAINSNFIRSCLPNILFEVEGEVPIADKLAPYIAVAAERLEDEYLMPGDFLNERDLNVALRLVVVNAFIDAIPAIDLVFTPTGFGVVSTDTIAPASKDRVDRLISSLRDQASYLLEILVDRLRAYPDWRISENGFYICSTFLSSMKDILITGAESFETMRIYAMETESFIADQFLGYRLMDLLREEYNARNALIYRELHQTLHNIVAEAVRARCKNEIISIWKLCQPIFMSLPRYPEYYAMWQEDKGELFNHEQFKNDIKGSYYF
ncbi:MAG: DUF6712 family protein [Lepagella sp.]